MFSFYHYADEWGNWVLVKATNENEAWGLLSGFLDCEPKGYSVGALDERVALSLLSMLEVPSYTRFGEVWETRRRFDSKQSSVIFGEAGGGDENI